MQMKGVSSDKRFITIAFFPSELKITVRQTNAVARLFQDRSKCHGVYATADRQQKMIFYRKQMIAVNKPDDVLLNQNCILECTAANINELCYSI